MSCIQFDHLYLVKQHHSDHQLSFHPVMNLFCPQVKNEGGRDAHAELTMLATAVTYNSLHRGECKKQSVIVNVPAHTG